MQKVFHCGNISVQQTAKVWIEFWYNTNLLLIKKYSTGMLKNVLIGSVEVCKQNYQEWMEKEKVCKQSNDKVHGNR